MKTTVRGLDWKRALVYGLGASGVAATRLLRAHGIEVVGVDRRPHQELGLDDLEQDSAIELRVGQEPDRLPTRLDGIVVSPGVPMDRPVINAARHEGLPVIAEVELGYRYAAGPIIGITGSNGKSTTTAMTGALLSGAGISAVVCGNIGVPLSAVVGSPERRVYVAELSSFQLESIDTFRPRAAALLNLSDDHLDRHRDTHRYLAAKAAIFRNQRGDDIAVLNADDAKVGRLVTQGRRRLFSRRGPVPDGCYLDGELVVAVDARRGRRVLFDRRDLNLDGSHNVENAMAAALLSEAMGAEAESFASTLTEFRGLPHRLERVRERGGVIWFDDSKATNFAATSKSLEGFEDGSVHLILGGRNKGGDATVLEPLVERKVRRMYLIGESADEMHRLFGRSVATELAGDLERAVDLAAAHARSGEIVLLSPACASFDQYRDFNQRGDHFRQLARNLDG